MAQATVIKGGSVRVYLGNNADPIVYTDPCGFTSRSINFNKTLSEEIIPDCENPDGVFWTARGAKSLSMDISGEGVLAKESKQIWLDAVKNPDSVPVKTELVFPGETTSWQGKMQVESLQITAPIGETVKASIGMKSDGEMVLMKDDKDAKNNSGN